MKYSEDGSRVLPERSWVCRLIGHAWHREAAQFMCLYECTRCQHVGYEGRSILERIQQVLWWWSHRFDNEVKRPLKGWLKCRECGLRFGRHDDNIDHLPF